MNSSPNSESGGKDCACVTDAASSRPLLARIDAVLEQYASPSHVLQLLRDLRGPVGMASEYQAWMDFFHAGTGDYADFMRQQHKDAS
jgi:hypothetical protein